MRRDWPAILKAVVPILVAVVAFVAWRRHEQWENHLKWENALRDPRPAVRADAIRRMPRGGNEELLITSTSDDNVDVRLLAVQRLRGLGPKGISLLIKALADDRLCVRREASWALSYVGREALAPLQEALKNDNPLIRAGAALALEDARRHKDSWLRDDDFRSDR
jgi:HEAT repeat protein